MPFHAQLHGIVGTLSACALTLFIFKLNYNVSQYIYILVVWLARSCAHQQQVAYVCCDGAVNAMHYVTFILTWSEQPINISFIHTQLCAPLLPLRIYAILCFWRSNVVCNDFQSFARCCMSVYSSMMAMVDYAMVWAMYGRLEYQLVYTLESMNLCNH